MALDFKTSQTAVNFFYGFSKKVRAHLHLDRFFIAYTRGIGSLFNVWVAAIHVGIYDYSL